MTEVCGEPKMCTAYRDLQKAAGVAQEQTVFLGAVFCALAAGVLALLAVPRRRDALRSTPREALRSVG